MLIPHVGMPELFPKKSFSDFVIEKVESTNHWHDFIDAIKGTQPIPSANFSYSGPLSETVLLGGLATRFPNETLKWNAEKLSFDGNEEATALIKRKYRKGWEVKGLS